MFSFEKVGTMYGESGGTLLCQEFHYKLIRKDQVFVVDVVVTYPMRKTVALSVINQPIVAIAKLSTITKVSKYKRL
jgi:hypothetical protein